MKSLRPQVRLRTLMVCIAAICAFLAGNANRVRREQLAIQKLTGLGIDVVVGSGAPKWLPRAFDGAWFEHVLAVDAECRGRKTGRVENWGHCDPSAPFSNIELFFCVAKQHGNGWRPDAGIVTDELVPTIAALHDCKALCIANSQISDDGLEYLKSLQRLQYLDVRGAQITDTAVAKLELLQGLVFLNIRGTQISDDGVKRLRRAPRVSDGLVSISGALSTIDVLGRVIDAVENHRDEGESFPRIVAPRRRCAGVGLAGD